MRRLWFPLLMALLLAACSSAPQRSARSGESTSPGGAFRTKPPGFPDFVDHSIGREEIPIQAMSLVGIPYRWGGNTPDSGFDCSGLVRYVFARSASVNLPRTTAEMSTRGESIDPDEIATGDLVFFNTTGRPHSHVGIYVGKLRFVNAPSTGGTVRLDYLNNPYWAKHFDGIRRVAPPKKTPAPFDVPTYQASRTPDGAPGVGGGATATPNAAAAGGYANGAAPSNASAASAYAAAPAPQPATPAQPADAFEPPPPAVSAAQQQARQAGAISPPLAAQAYQPAPPAQPAQSTPLTQPVQAAPARDAQQYAPARTASAAPSYPSPATATPSDAHPDAIDAAADAFEPPPPSAATAQQQARNAQQPQPSAPTAAPEPQGTQIMRASTSSRGQPIRTPSGDDPIARFANGTF